MFCKNCGAKLEDDSKFCTVCGARVEAAPAEAAQEAVQAVAEAAPVEVAQEAVQAVAEAAPAEAAQEAVQTVIEPVQESVVEAAQEVVQENITNSTVTGMGMGAAAAGAFPNATSMEQPVMQQAPVQQQIYSPIPEDKPAKKKGGKGKIVLGVVAGVVVVSGVLVATNFAKASNWFMKTFNSPQKYYQWVEKKAVDDGAALAADVYSSQISTFMNWGNQKYTGYVSLDLEKPTMDMLAALANQDVSWLQHTRLDMTINQKDKDAQINLGGSLGNDKIVSFDILADGKNNNVYVAVPELSAKYLKADGSEFADGLAEAANPLNNLQLKEFFPDDKFMEDFIKKYGKLVIENLDKVEMDNGATLTAGEVSQNCTELDLTIDAEVAKKIILEVLEEMKKDSELKEEYEKIAKASKEYMKAIYGEDLFNRIYDEEENDFDKGLAEAIKEANELSTDSKAVLVMKVFVDNKGEIIGRHFVFTDEYNSGSLTASMPKDGDKIGCEVRFFNGDDVTFYGVGEEKNGKLTGSYELSANGKVAFTVGVKDLDVDSAKKGYLNGEFDLAMGKALLREIDDDAAAFAGMNLVVKIQSEKNKVETALSAIMNGVNYGTITFSTTVSSGENVSFPADSIAVDSDLSEDALMEYVETMSVDGIIEKLEKHNLPEEIIDELKDFRDQLEMLLEYGI